MSQEENQQKYWDKVSDRIARLEYAGPARMEIEDFFRFIKLKKKMNILDVGCGAGRLTLPLLRLGCKITGTEIANENLKKLSALAKKEGLSKRLILKKTNFEKPIWNQVFDIAICCNVIHHFDPKKKEKIIANIAASIKKGGIIALIEPNPLNFLYYIRFLQLEITGQDKGRWNVEKDMLNSTKGKLTSLLKKIGVNNLETEMYAVIPSRVATIFKPVLTINKFLRKIPLIKEFGAFIWIKAKKL